MLRLRHFASQLGRRWAPRLVRLEDRLAPAITQWLGNNVSLPQNWSNPINWSAGVPGSLDTATFSAKFGGNFIPSPASTVDAPFVVAAVVFDATYTGTLTVGSGLTTTGISSLVSGGVTINSAGSWTNSGSLTTAFTIANQGALDNSGTITLGPAAQINIVTGSVITNQASATIDLQGDNNFNWVSGATPPVTTNKGLIRKSGGVTQSFIQGAFRNEGGVLDVQTGTLDLQSSGLSTGGTFNVAAGAILDINTGSTPTYQGTYTGAGGGTIRWDGAINAGTGATLNFPVGLLQWNGGSLSAGSLTNVNHLTLTAGHLAANTTLINKATIAHAGATLSWVTNAVIANEVGATWDIQSDGDISWTSGSTAPVLTNKGTIRKSGGSLTSIIEAKLQNDAAGVLDVQSGTLELLTSGTSAGGTFTVAATAVLDISGNSPIYQGTYTGSGAGTVRWDSTISAGTGATFNFPAGLLVWSGGSLGTGTLTNVNQITLNSGQLSATATLINKGTVTQAVGNLNWATGSVITNEAGATWDIRSDGDFDHTSGSGSPVLNNKGIIRKSAGAAVSFMEADFRNDVAGIIDVQIGTLELQTVGISAGGTFNVTAGAMLDISTGSPIYQGSYTGSGAGTVRWDSNISAGTGAVFNFPAGMLQWNGGALSAGTLNNTGHITLITGTMSSTATFINLGTVAHTTGNLGFVSGSIVTNAVTAIWDFQGDGDFNHTSGTTGPVTTNLGLIRKTGATGVSFIQGDFRNENGTIDVQSGTIELQSNGVSTGGTFKTAAGTTLDLATNLVPTYQGTYTGMGTGTVLWNGPINAAKAGTSFNFPAGMLQWNVGSLSTGMLINDNHITLTAGTMSNSATLVNQGIVVHLGGNLSIVTGTVITNAAPGVWDFQGDGDLSHTSGTAGPIITNLGLIRKSAGVGVSFIEGDVRNLGAAMEVLTGTLELQSNGTSTGGIFTVAKGAVLDIATTRTPTYLGTYTGSGAGTVLWNGTIVADKAGTTFNFPVGLCQWNGGALSAGTLVNIGQITLTTGSLTSTATLINRGTIAQVGALTLVVVTGSVITNDTTGIWGFQDNGDIDWTSGSTAPVLNNKGLIRKTAGAAVSFIEANHINTGTIDVQTGALESIGVSINNLGGLINVKAGASFDTIGTLNVQFGTLQGGGTINAPVTNSQGFVRPGTSPGTLTIVGNYVQGNTAQLTTELNGLAPGTDYDQLAVNGTVTLAGTLKPSIGYAAQIGDAFVIIANDSTDKVTGTFNGLAEGAVFPVGTAELQITYKGGSDNNDVVLSVTKAGTGNTTTRVAAVVVNEGAVQRSRVTSVRVQFDDAVTLPANPADAFQLKRQGNNAIVTLNATVVTNPTTSVLLTFTGGPVDNISLADGRYTLTVDATKVAGPGGAALDGNGDGTPSDNYVLVGDPAVGPKLYRLFGDFDADNDVDSGDFGAFRQVYGGTSFEFDFDNDGDVDTSDFGQFRGRFGSSV